MALGLKLGCRPPPQYGHERHRSAHGRCGVFEHCSSAWDGQHHEPVRSGSGLTSSGPMNRLRSSRDAISRVTRLRSKGHRGVPQAGVSDGLNMK